MRRKDREITERESIVDVLMRCDTVSIGFRGEEYPYVVPVSFGAVLEGETLSIYYHSANEGTKINMAENYSKVCVEGHIFHGVENITTHYESVIAYGTVEKVQGEEAIAGLKAITEHYGYADYPVDSCESFPKTGAYKITVESITGKRNL